MKGHITNMRGYLLLSCIIVPACLLLIVATTLLRPILPSFAASASISLSLTYGPPTSSVTVSGKGFKSSEIVTLSFDSTQLSTPKANTKGTFSSTITVPSSALPGNHTVQAKGKSSGSIAIATFLVQTDWSQAGFNRQRWNYNPFENVLTTGNVSSIVQDWTWSGSDCVSNAPVIATGILYLLCSQHVYALTASTGQFLWSYATSATITSQDTAIQNGLLYFGTSDSKLTAINAATGAFVWSVTVSPSISYAPIVGNGNVYVVAGTTLSELNGANGSKQWDYVAKANIIAAPAMDNGYIYLGTSDGSITAVIGKTGKQQWIYTTRGGMQAAPTASNGVVYFNSLDEHLYALNETTGALLWGSPILVDAYTSPTAANGLVYSIVRDNNPNAPSNCNLDALDASTGELIWTFDTTAGPQCVQSTPVVANGVVYATGFNDDPAEALLFGFNALTGASILLEDNFGVGIVSSVNGQAIVVNGMIYLNAADTTYAFHLPGTTP